PKRYDRRIRPSGNVTTYQKGDKDYSNKNPVVVEMNMFVRRISNFDEKNQAITMQITLRQSWTDERLKFSPNEADLINFVNLEDAASIWTPDLFISNEISGKQHTLLKPNLLIRIFPNGRVLYSTRLTLTLSCPMDFSRFPHDYQTCTIKLASCMKM
ncbi:glutamate-gated chloride channel-like protein, partial [Dinothrombium tinctorium]